MECTSHTNADESQYNVKYSDVTAHKQLNNSPFQAIRYLGKWRVSYGDNQLSDREFNSFDELQLWIDSKPYEIILIASNIYRENYKSYINHIKNKTK